MHEELRNRVLLPLSVLAVNDLKAKDPIGHHLLIAIRTPRAFVASDPTTEFSASSRNLAKKNNTMAHKIAAGESNAGAIAELETHHSQCMRRGADVENPS
jgi:hypothetical protein